MSNKQSITCKSTVKKADRSHLENLTLLKIIVDKTLWAYTSFLSVKYIYTYIYIYIYIYIYTRHTPDKDYKYSLRTIPKTIHHTIHSMKPFINLIRNMNFMLLKCKTWNNQQESHQVQYQNNPTVRNTKESKPSLNKKIIRSITSCRF